MRGLGFVLVVTALAGCGRRSLDDLRFDQRRDFPGFTLALPRVKPMREDVTPAAGEVVMRAGGAVLAIGWQAGTIARADLPMMARSVAAGVSSATGAADTPASPLALAEPDYGFELALDTDKGVTLVMSVVQCVRAKVTVTVSSMGAKDRAVATRLHHRLMSGFACAASGPVNTTAAGLPEVELGDDVAYLPGSDPPTFVGLHGARWYVTPGTRGQRAVYGDRDAIRGMFRGLGMEIATIDAIPPPTPGDWISYRVTATSAGEEGHFLVGLLSCAHDATYAVFQYAPETTGATTSADLGRIRCPSGPVDAATLPTVPARLGGACDRGDGLACATLASLVDEEGALLPGLDATALRGKACAAGLREACPGPP